MDKIIIYLAKIFAHIKTIAAQNKCVIKSDDYILIKISDGNNSPKKLMEEKYYGKEQNSSS